MNVIVMPKIGLTMSEGTLVSWLVGPGMEVRPGDVMFVVETDKAATDITARAAGRIDDIKVQEGETVAVGTVVATWSAPPQLDESDTRVVATPYAKRLARSLNMDLRAIKGTGPRGRVKAGDLRPSGRDIAAVDAPTKLAERPAEPRRRALSNVEKTVARRLTAAKQEIPHFYVMAEADVTQLLESRTRLNSGARNPKISLNHLLLLATGRALLANPEFNVAWDNEGIVSLPGSDVGMAVDTPGGLFAPVLRNIGSQRLDVLAQEVGTVIELARSGHLQPEQLLGGAVSVSNVGMYGASWIVPIINPGQSSIVGVGAVKGQFRPDASGLPELRQIISLVLAADHRVLDGVKAARFLNAIINQLEHPAELSA